MTLDSGIRPRRQRGGSSATRAAGSERRGSTKRAVVRRANGSRLPAVRVGSTDVVPTVPGAEDLWLASLKARNRSPHTLKSYRNSVEHFRAWRGPGDLTTVTRGEAMAYVAWMSERYAPGGVNIRVRSLRALYGFLVREEILDKNPFRSLSLTVPDEARLTATVEEIQAMLDRAKPHRRNHALLSMLLSTGARKNEVANLEAGDINFHDGLVTFRISKTRARTVPLSDQTLVAVTRWMRERGVGPGSLWSSPRRPVTKPY
jgi:site-specific recombinase XerD